VKRVNGEKELDAQLHRQPRLSKGDGTMKSRMHPSIRTGLLAVAALQGAAIALVAPSAHATWYCGIVDGPGNPNMSGFANSGGTTNETWGATSAISFEASPYPLYVADNNSGQSVLKSGTDNSWPGSQCSGNYDPYNLSVVDPTPNLNGPGAAQYGENVVLAYTDQSDGFNGGNLYASFSIYGPSAGTMIYNAAANGNWPTAFGTPAVAFLTPLGQTAVPYVFFSVTFPESNGDNYTELFYQSYNQSTGEWSGGSGGSPGSFVTGSAYGSFPTAVTWNEALWMFYWDSAAGCLKGTTSSNGSTWTATQAYEGNGCIDGGSGFVGNTTYGQTADHVGIFATAIVDTSNNRLNVFYSDYSATTVRFSYLDSGSSTWYSGVVQSDVDLIWPPAPVMNGESNALLQVFYINHLTNSFQGVTRTGNTFSYQATIDGGFSNYCGSNGGTSHALGGPVAGVWDWGVCRDGYGPGGSAGPHFYYSDAATGALREAFEY
jgi:hypothetical protein